MATQASAAPEAQGDGSPQTRLVVSLGSAGAGEVISCQDSFRSTVLLREEDAPAGWDSVLMTMNNSSGHEENSAKGEELDDLFNVVHVSQVNRVSSAVFTHFGGYARAVGPAEETIAIEEILFTMMLPGAFQLLAAVQALLRLQPDSKGRRKGQYRSVQLWLVPNDLDGLTLTFPEKS